jgi:hypothetical protein
MVVILVHDNYSAPLQSCRRVATVHYYEYFESTRNFTLVKNMKIIQILCFGCRHHFL